MATAWLASTNRFPGAIAWHRRFLCSTFNRPRKYHYHGLPTGLLDSVKWNRQALAVDRLRQRDRVSIVRGLRFERSQEIRLVDHGYEIQYRLKKG